MDIELPAPPLSEGFPIFGSVVNDREFQGLMPTGLFRALVPDPRKLESLQARYNLDLAPVAKVRERVQRLIAGAKRKNVEPFADYIIRMVETQEGFTPQIVLWTPKRVKVEEDPNTGFAWAIVPHETKLVAIDGDTHTTARWLAEHLKPGLQDKQKV